MKRLGKYVFSERKNALLERERGVGFIQLVMLIESGNLMDVIDHPDMRRYPKQKLYVIDVDEYTWAMAHESDGENVKLFTAYPSRKLNELYKKGRHYEKEKK